MHGENLVAGSSRSTDFGCRGRHVATRRGAALRGRRGDRDTLGARVSHHRGDDSRAERRSHRIEAFHAIIDGAIKAQVDITLFELADMLHREHGVSFAPSTLWRFLDRHGITFKKNRARQRAGAARRRRAASAVARYSAAARRETPGLHR